MRSLMAIFLELVHAHAQACLSAWADAVTCPL